MNSRNLVRPIRSLQRFRARESATQARRVPAAELLSEIMRPGDDAGHCATNVVVYGGQDPSATAFAAAVLSCLGQLDSLWLVGNGETSDPRVIWVGKEERVLSMLNARILFVPGESLFEGVSLEWQERADVAFVGPGPRAGSITHSFSGSQTSVWQWGEECVRLEVVAPLRESEGGDTSGHGLEGWDASYPHPERAGHDERASLFFGARVSFPIAMANARTDTASAGEMNAAFRFDCWSPDSTVRAAVRGAPGGDISVVFAATDPMLEGTEILLAFRSSEGGVLEGRCHLWKDDAHPDRLVAFWSGNQLQLSPPEGRSGGGPEEAAQLIFEFRVLPPPHAPDSE